MCLHSYCVVLTVFVFFFFQAEDGIRDAQESRGLGDVYKRQDLGKYLKFEVTPKNSEEPGTGTAVLSDPTGQVTGLSLIHI